MKSIRKKWGIFVAALCLLGATRATQETRAGEPESAGRVPGGELHVRGDKGQDLGGCRLQHTDVQADISGYVCRTRVTQIFQNPLNRKIEAVYTFPLPHESAVDEMTMTVGTHRVKGIIQEKEQARKTYETAKNAGHVAGLLDQERPNIFTQSVANIEPGAQVTIEIAFTETLKWEDGVYEWVFPTVVGPRYMPGQPAGASGTGWSPDTDQVRDASRISPPVAPPPSRSGHDISLTVKLDSGGPALRDIKSELHPIRVENKGQTRAVVTLQDQATLPNKDFILRYRTASEHIEDGLLMTSDGSDVYFTLALQPPLRVRPAEARPKEMIFVIDASGSMQGFPLDKAKQTMKLCIEGMNPRDTFNLFSFASGTGQCFKQPVPGTPANRSAALKFLEGLSGGGGTEMMGAINATLTRPADPNRLRVMCFMSDGYVGNDREIIEAVKKKADVTRVFAFGVGQSVNRFLIENMARAGRGASEVVTLQSDAGTAAKRFFERVDSPVLTDIKLDWGDLPVEEVFPKAVPDLFSNGPIMLHGRMKVAKAGTITLRGNTGEGRFTRQIKFDPANAEEHEALPSLWARAKVNDLTGAQSEDGADTGKIKGDITGLAVQYHLMTQYTSFVAVDEQSLTKGGAADTVAVPVENPEGASYTGVFGNNSMASPSLYARAGDPLINVTAPADAVQVIALLPGGEVKRLRFIERENRWQARFDIPTYAAEGDYEITVVIVLKNGARQTLALHYSVDETAPVAGGQAIREASSLRLQLDGGDDTNRVVALLPWGERVALKNAAGRFTTRISVPPAWQGRASQITFIVTDRAHNRTMLTLDLN